MNVSAEQVRAATRTAAAVITAEKVPPLRLDESPRRHRLALRPRLGRFAPLAAAAAVLILVAGSVAAGSWLARPGSGNSGTPEQGAPAGSFAGVPPFYVAVASPSLAVVRPPRPGPSSPGSRRGRHSSALPGPPTTGRSSLTHSAR